MRPVLEDYEQSPLLRRDLEALRQSEPTVTLAQVSGIKREACASVFSQTMLRHMAMNFKVQTLTKFNLCLPPL